MLFRSTSFANSGPGSGLLVISIDTRNMVGQVTAELWSMVTAQHAVCIAKFPLVDVDSQATYVLTFGGRGERDMVDSPDFGLASGRAGLAAAALYLRLVGSGGVVFPRDQWAAVIKTGRGLI